MQWPQECLSSVPWCHMAQVWRLSQFKTPTVCLFWRSNRDNSSNSRLNRPTQVQWDDDVVQSQTILAVIWCFWWPLYQQPFTFYNNNYRLFLTNIVKCLVLCVLIFSCLFHNLHLIYLYCLVYLYTLNVHKASFSNWFQNFNFLFLPKYQCYTSDSLVSVVAVY